MNIPDLHPWDLDYESARKLQIRLQERLCLIPLDRDIKYVCGCDVSSPWRGKDFWAAAVVLNYPAMEIVEVAAAHHYTVFPYIPGLLSFREMPALLKAFRKLQTIPDLIFVDGTGILHPRKLGLAAHLGLWLDLPAIGCAKNLLCGQHQPIATAKGSSQPVTLDGEIVGAAVRTRTAVKPMFISPGNLVTLEDSIAFTLEACPRYRIPEPVRAAHKAANSARIEAVSS